MNEPTTKKRTPSAITLKMQALRRIEEAKARLDKIRERDERQRADIHTARQLATDELALAEQALAALSGHPSVPSVMETQVPLTAWREDG